LKRGSAPREYLRATTSLSFATIRRGRSQMKESWTREKELQGFAGAPAFRMVSTEAGLNDHWVEL
jgi:hypothetical protein